MPAVELRPYCDEDVPLLQRYLNDPITTRYLTSAIAQPYTQADAEYWVYHLSRSMGAQAIQWQGQFVGDIGAFCGNFEKAYSAEMGFWLGREFWGRGIATRALTIVTQQLFTQTKIVRASAQVFIGNNASCRVLQKCGYTQEAHLRLAAYKNGHHHDVLLYTQLKPTETPQG
jgi:[ribosomal protein S5]-alanine N-acetyltransferase